MLDKIWKKLYPKLFKKPCYTCLVLATCQHKKHRWERTCDEKRKWKNKEYSIEKILDTIEMWTALTIFLIVILWIIGTFILGMWKWYNLIISYLG